MKTLLNFKRFRHSSTDYRNDGMRDTHWIWSSVSPKSSCTLWRRENLFAPTAPMMSPSSIHDRALRVYKYTHIHTRICQGTLFWYRLFQCKSHILYPCTTFSIIIPLMDIPNLLSLLMLSKPVACGPPVAYGDYSKQGKMKHLLCFPPAKPR